MTPSMKLIQLARGALNDLYGLIPVEDRAKYADPNMRILEKAIHEFASTMDYLAQVKHKAEWAERDIERAAQHMNAIETGEE